MNAPFDVIDFCLRPVEARSPKSAVGSVDRPSGGFADSTEWVERLDSARVRHAVAWGRCGTRDCAGDNAAIAGLQRDHAHLFTGFGGVPLPEMGGIATTMNAVDEALVTHGFKGIVLDPGAQPFVPMAVDDRRLYPVYERCVELGGLLGLSLGGQRTSETTIADAEPFGADHVARDFPGLRIVVAHACWPWPELSIGLAFRRRNVYLMPDVYALGMPGAEIWVEAANTFLGDRLIFGSTYPARDIGKMVQGYANLDFDPGIVENVMHNNAAALLGLAVPRARPL